MDIPENIKRKFPLPKEIMMSRINKEGIHCFCLSEISNGGVVFCITSPEKSLEFEFNRAHSLRAIADWLNEKADMMDEKEKDK